MNKKADDWAEMLGIVDEGEIVSKEDLESECEEIPHNKEGGKTYATEEEN